MKLWEYNAITGLWKLAKTCQPHEAEQWLAIFKKHEPDKHFKLSNRKPKDIISE